MPKLVVYTKSGTYCTRLYILALANVCDLCFFVVFGKYVEVL